MSAAGESVVTPPEGAVAITAKDVIAQAVPERFEKVEYWLVRSGTGLVESMRIRPEINEKAELQVSPLDGSILGLRFEFRGGDKNEITGRRFFPATGMFHFDVAYSEDPVYKNGESPAEVEMKRRDKLREQRIAERAAKLADGLDRED